MTDFGLLKKCTVFWYMGRMEVQIRWPAGMMADVWNIMLAEKQNDTVWAGYGPSSAGVQNMIVKSLLWL